MAKRGRKSAAELETALVASPRLYPEPPDRLSAREQELWRSIVRSRPTNWWNAGSLPMLEAYAVAVYAQERAAAALASIDAEALRTPEGAAVFNELSRAFDRQARLVAQLAGKQRLSQSSTIEPRTAARADRDAGTRSWELPPNDPLAEFRDGGAAKPAKRLWER